MKDIKINILWLLLIPLGLIFYLLINYFLFGNALKFLEIMKSHWYKTLNWPWVGLIETIKSFNWRSIYDVIMVSGAEISFALLGLFLIIFIFKYLRPSYSVYVMLNWLVVTSTSFWLSIPRYTLLFFPIFIILAIFNKYPAVDKLITIIFLMFYTTFLSLFIQGRWAF